MFVSGLTQIILAELMRGSPIYLWGQIRSITNKKICDISIRDYKCNKTYDRPQIKNDWQQIWTRNKHWRVLDCEALAFECRTGPLLTTLFFLWKPMGFLIVPMLASGKYSSAWREWSKTWELSFKHTTMVLLLRRVLVT